MLMYANIFGHSLFVAEPKKKKKQNGEQPFTQETKKDLLVQGRIILHFIICTQKYMYISFQLDVTFVESAGWGLHLFTLNI